MRVVADENIPGLQPLLGAKVTLRQLPGRLLTAADLVDADALLVRSVTRVDQALLSGSAVRFVGSATSGYDHIDTGYLTEAGIDFAHAPGANANSVVEYVLAAIASVDDFLERALDTARVGIVGYGHVGKKLAGRLDALGIAYSVYDPWLDPAAVRHGADLQSVLESDIVTLHPLLTDESPFPSRHLLGKESLGGFTARQLLINTSRGPVIDNAALLERLREPAPPAVVLDVWEGEPLIDAALLNCVQLGTAHIAGYSLDGKLHASRMLVQALAHLLPDAAATSQAEQATPVPWLPGTQGAALIRDLLLAHCPITSDDAQLRKAVVSDNPAAAFDGLRRDYAPRYELAGKLIPTEAPDEQATTLAALGCRPPQVAGQ